MKALSIAFVVLGLRSVAGVLGAAIQVPLSTSPSTGGVEGDGEGDWEIAKPNKRLHGRFLHITDIHPDGHYRAGTAEIKACHRKHPSNKKKNVAGYYGTAYSSCDSSFRLANFTLDYIGKNWASEIDFVVWTGDSARHDNDHSFPRTPEEIFDLNRAVTAKMEKIFVKRGIPVVPSLGNNDIWRPNRVTTEFLSIWESFIPFTYRQVFHRGAYYSRTIIPNELAIISLNTLYFYDSNSVVNGCPWGDEDDPGNLEMDWLEVQLESYHQRDMKVYVTGHVPPSPGNYFPECFVRYSELALRYQNVILGHLFGHMNVDHFFFLESIDLDIIPDNEKELRTAGNDLALYDVLLAEYSALPKRKKTNYDEYAVVNVAPSVVPDYLPSFRIYSYNNSEGVTTAGKRKKHPKKPPKRKHGRDRGERGDKKKHCKEEKYRNSWKCHLKAPWNSDEEAPSRTNRQWSPLGYAQYNMPNLDEANKTVTPVFELEYVTFPVETLGSGEELLPLRHLPEELKTAAAEGGKSKYAPYSMPDLTVASWVQLARKVADEKRVKLRRRYKKYMFGGGY